MAFDLDLHCLPMSLLWDARLKCVKCILPPNLVIQFKRYSLHTIQMEQWKDEQRVKLNVWEWVRVGAQKQTPIVYMYFTK